MTAKHVELKPGWLQRELDDVAALERGQRKIVAASKTARENGHTQPTKVEFTIAELHALAHMARYQL